MLSTVTKDDRLREQYRLHEEFMRVQRGEEARKEKLKRQYSKALLDLEKAVKAKEEERKAKEQERKAKEEALKQKEEVERISIVSFRKAGYSNEEIVKMLNISLQKVQSISL